MGRTEEIYDFILAFKAEHDGNAPTVRQICAATLGQGGRPVSTSVVGYHLDKLIKTGWLRRGIAGLETIQKGGNTMGNKIAEFEASVMRYTVLVLETDGIPDVTSAAWLRGVRDRAVDLALTDFDPKFAEGIDAFCRRIVERRLNEKYTDAESLGHKLIYAAKRGARRGFEATQRENAAEKSKTDTPKTGAAETPKTDTAELFISNSFFQRYTDVAERAADAKTVIPPDWIVAVLAGVSLATIAPCRMRLKDKGYEFAAAPYAGGRSKGWRVTLPEPEPEPLTETEEMALERLLRRYLLTKKGGGQ